MRPCGLTSQTRGMYHGTQLTRSGRTGGPMTEEDKMNVRDALNAYLKPYLRG